MKEWRCLKLDPQPFPLRLAPPTRRGLGGGGRGWPFVIIVDEDSKSKGLHEHYMCGVPYVLLCIARLCWELSVSDSNVFDLQQPGPIPWQTDTVSCGFSS